MQREMAAIESDPQHPVSSEFMRAAHTLASSSRTTGFEGVAEVAHALEKWLQDAIELPPEFDAKRLAGTRGAVDALDAMVTSVRGQALPHPREDVVATLAGLREGLKESRRTGEGTHLRMPGLLREEHAAPIVIETPAPAAEVAPAPETTPGARARRRFVTRACCAATRAGKDQRKIKDDVDRDLLPVFLRRREIIPGAEGVRRARAPRTMRARRGPASPPAHPEGQRARSGAPMRLRARAHVLEERSSRSTRRPNPKRRL
jgi:chemotaxis protein histidine kinase CheA